MVSRFTQKAQKALEYAMAMASKMGHTYIGSEHILLGLSADPDATAAKLLDGRGIRLRQIEDGVAECDGIGAKTRLSPLDMTPKTKRIIETASSLATRTGDSQIGTEHLLLALLGEQNCVATQILQALSVNISDLKSDTLSLLSGDQRGEDGKKALKKADKSANTALKNLPALSHYARDLTAMAKEGKIDPVIGRDSETARLIQILCRRQKNNPCLIGEPGVGKTAVVEGVATRIAEGNVPDLLKGKWILTLDISSMIAGAKYRGEFEDRMKNVMEEVKNHPEIILFIDEIHTIVGAGAAEGAVDAANILKPALARGELQVIGATTTPEYRKHIEKDAALERRFQAVMVGEPTEEETVLILHGLKDKYEKHHQMKITDSAIEAAVKLSSRYISDRFLPDKAIDLVDEAMAKLRISDCTSPECVVSLEQELQELEKKKEEAVLAQQFELAAKWRDKAKGLREKIEEEKEKAKQKKGKDALVLTKEDIAEVVTLWTGIPVDRLAEKEQGRLAELPKRLKARVIGQDSAVEKLAKAIQRGRVGLKDPKRPIGSFIFLGPTGVGKTELCKALAEEMFGSESEIIRLDMSEYMEKHSVSKLIGSPPGYVGFEEGGQLTEKIRRKPYTVVLFDEIEKAHPDVTNILLQVLEDGQLTDAQGRRVNFKNTVLIMTSNLGADQRIAEQPLGFGERQSTASKKKQREEQAMLTLKKTFRPEFLNRIDDIIVFQKLEKREMEEIAALMLGEVQKRAADLGISLSFSKEVLSHIAEVGYDQEYGARPLRRTVTRLVEDALSTRMLGGDIRVGDKVEAVMHEGQVDFVVFPPSRKGKELPKPKHHSE